MRPRKWSCGVLLLIVGWVTLDLSVGQLVQTDTNQLLNDFDVTATGDFVIVGEEIEPERSFYGVVRNLRYLWSEHPTHSVPDQAQADKSKLVSVLVDSKSQYMYFCGDMGQVVSDRRGYDVFVYKANFIDGTVVKKFYGGSEFANGNAGGTDTLDRIFFTTDRSGIVFTGHSSAKMINFEGDNEGMFAGRLSISDLELQKGKQWNFGQIENVLAKMFSTIDEFGHVYLLGQFTVAGQPRKQSLLARSNLQESDYWTFMWPESESSVNFKGVVLDSSRNVHVIFEKIISQFEVIVEHTKITAEGQQVWSDVDRKLCCDNGEEFSVKYTTIGKDGNVHVVGNRILPVEDKGGEEEAQFTTRVYVQSPFGEDMGRRNRIYGASKQVLTTAKLDSDGDKLYFAERNEANTQIFFREENYALQEPTTKPNGGILQLNITISNVRGKDVHLLKRQLEVIIEDRQKLTVRDGGARPVQSVVSQKLDSDVLTVVANVTLDSSTNAEDAKRAVELLFQGDNDVATTMGEDVRLESAHVLQLTSNPDSVPPEPPQPDESYESEEPEPNDLVAGANIFPLWAWIIASSLVAAIVIITLSILVVLLRRRKQRKLEERKLAEAYDLLSVPDAIYYVETNSATDASVDRSRRY